MKTKISVKQFITALIVVVLLLNIETVELALFLNTMGIDVVLLLIEVQLAALLVASYHCTIKPVANFFLGFSAHPFILPTGSTIKNYPGAIAFMVPPGAIIMFLLFGGGIVWLICQLIY